MSFIFPSRQSSISSFDSSSRRSSHNGGDKPVKRRVSEGRPKSRSSKMALPTEGSNVPMAKIYPVLEGKVAIVTGAASGMGKATAEVMAMAKASVVVADISENQGKEVASNIEKAGGKAIFVKCDISKSEEVKQLVQKTVKVFGKLDIAVNNAAVVLGHTSLSELDEDDWNKSIAINLTGTALCLKHEIAQMVAQGNGGSIINIASTNAFRVTVPNMAAYNASKHGVVGLTKTAAVENSKYGIRVNTVAPGPVSTPLSTKWLTDSGTTIEEFASQIPLLKRFAAPHEVAQGTLWLASDAASYVTNITMPIDAGFGER